MQKESTWSAIKAGFPVGATFFGALVGPVMVTGSYTVNYFLCTGVKGWLLAIIYAIAISWFFTMGFEHTRATAEANPGMDVYSYQVLSKSLYGPKLQFLVPVYNLWIFFAMVLTGAATVSVGGTMISTLFGISYISGAIIMSLLIIVISIFGAEVVRKASTYMTFAMVAMMFLLVIITLATREKELGEVFASNWTPETNYRSFGSSAWRIFVLCCSSCSWALGLGIIAQKMTTKKSTAAGGISAGVLGAVAFVLMFLVCAPWVDKIFANGEINGSPVLDATTNWLGMPWLGVIYYLLMILALVSSGAPSAFIAANTIRSIIPAARKSTKDTLMLLICSALFQVIVIFLAATGINAIVSKYFQYLGYFGQIFGVIPMAIIWPILRAKGVKPIVPVSAKKSGVE